MIGVLICFFGILILQLATPFWWWIMAVPFVFAIFKARSGWDGFRTGMLSAGALWLLASLYYWLTGSGIIVSRVADMMGVGSPVVVLLATTLIAILAAGFSGTTGYFLRGAFKK